MAEAPLSLFLGHGDDDPHGVELFGGSGASGGASYCVVANGIDWGQPDETTDRRTITILVRVKGDTRGACLQAVNDLAKWGTRADQRETGTLEPVTLRVSGGGYRPAWWDVVSLEVDQDTSSVQLAYQAKTALVHLVFTTLALARGQQLTVVSDALVDQTTPVLALPPVDTDGPAQLEIDIDDLTTYGTGVNQWKISAMPLADSGKTPPLVVDFTGDTAAPGLGTISGNTPVAGVFTDTWKSLGARTIQWDGDTPPPRVVEVLARVKDHNTVGSPIEQVQASIGRAAMDFYQTVWDDSTNLVFQGVQANSLLVAFAWNFNGDAITFPAGWTVQKDVVDSGSDTVYGTGGLAQINGRTIDTVRMACATYGPVATAMDTASCTVTGAGAVGGYEITNVSSIVGAFGGSDTEYTVPGSPTGTSYHAVVAAQAEIFGQVFFWSPNFSAVSVQSSARIASDLPVSDLLGQFPPLIPGPSAQLYSALSTGAPGTVTFSAGTTISTSSVFFSSPPTTEAEYNADMAYTQPWVIDNPFIVGANQLHYAPAAAAARVGLCVTTTEPAPVIPAAQYRVGVTQVSASGTETPMIATDDVYTQGIRPIQVNWLQDAASAVGEGYQRVYVLQMGSSWAYEQVDASVNTATITTLSGLTAGSPPQSREVEATEIRALLRNSLDVNTAIPLGSGKTAVGGGNWELVPIGTTPLPQVPVVPGQPTQLNIELQARSSFGARQLTLDRLYLLPVYQPLGTLLAEFTDIDRPIPMRWRHHVDPRGRQAMLVTGIYAFITATNTLILVGPGSTAAASNTPPIPRVLIASGTPDYVPSRSFGTDGPTWWWRRGTVPNGVYGAVAPHDAGLDASPMGGDPYVGLWTDDDQGGATTISSPPVPVTAGNAYSAWVAVRTPPSGTNISVTPKIAWYTNAGALVSTSSGTAQTTSQSWTNYSVQATAPATAGFATIQLAKTATGTLWIDADQVSAGTVAMRTVQSQVLRDNLLPDGAFTTSVMATMPDQMSGSSHSFGWTPGGFASGTANASQTVGLHFVPVIVTPGATYTFSATFTGTNFTINTPVTITAATTTYLPVFSATYTPTSGFGSFTLDNVCFQAGSSTSYVAPALDLPVATSGPIAVPNAAVLTDLTPETGWLALRFATARVVRLAVWSWHDGTPDNALWLEVEDDTVTFHRTTAGVDTTVATARPSATDQELIVVCAWSATELSIRLWGATDGWSSRVTAASTSWPDLTGQDWHLGAFGADGLPNYALDGVLVWAACGAGAWDPADDAMLVTDELVPNDIPDAAALGWLWAASNAYRLVIWEPGGWSPINGRLYAMDRESALVVMPTDAGGTHGPGVVKLTVRATPKMRSLRGSN